MLLLLKFYDFVKSIHDDGKYQSQERREREKNVFFFKKVLHTHVVKYKKHCVDVLYTYE